MGKPGPKPLRASGKAYSGAERMRRHRLAKKCQAKAEADATQRALRGTGNSSARRPAKIDQRGHGGRPSAASVDAVVTDPPYPKASVPLYGELGCFAMRVLRPGGWCLTMCGDFYLDEIMALLKTSGLKWRGHLIADFVGGPHAGLHEMKLFQDCRPVLIWQKPPLSRPAEWRSNRIPVKVGDWNKELHPWQQSPSLFETLIERFTQPEDLVADPFAGAGTTLKAAVTLGRRAWGCDIDGRRSAMSRPPNSWHAEVRKSASSASSLFNSLGGVPSFSLTPAAAACAFVLRGSGFLMGMSHNDFFWTGGIS